MDKDMSVRLIVFVVFCSVIFIGWQFFFFKPVPKTQTQMANDSIEHQFSERIESPKESDAGTVNVFSVNTSNFKIVFDEDSADILSITLPKYGEGEASPTFISSNGGAFSKLSAGINSGFRIKESSSEKIVFEAANHQVYIRKSYFWKEGYNIPVEIFVENLTDTAISLPVSASMGTGMGAGFEAGDYVFNGYMLYSKKDERTVKKDKKLAEPEMLNKPLWAGVTSKYFLFAFMNGGFERAEIVKNEISDIILRSQITLEPAQSYTVPNFSIFAGPKHYDELKSYGIKLQKSIDYGIFAFIGIPMTQIMKFTYRFTRNYGISIIILTMIVKIVTLPLTIKSMVSMRGMSKLQPEMLALKEKYKEEPQKLNAATMELYKKHNINPLSGCLPMLLQLPIFFALYKSLLVSIELKGAPFFGWIHDLSVADPYYITPILMGATMFLQQKMTPSTADPMQQKIFLIMPIVFTFLFLKFQSGLVVYWLTNNVLSVAQQYVINKKFK